MYYNFLTEGESINLFELSLADTTVSASMIKVLREYFPDTSIGELKRRIESNDVIFSCSGGSYDGKKSMMKMIQSLNHEGIPIQLCEQTDSKTYSLTVKELQAFTNRGRAIGKQVIEDMENEADE